jgi:hypothetical protein
VFAALFLRRYLKLFLAPAIALVLGAVAFGTWLLPRGTEPCFTQVVQRIPGPGMYDVAVSETGCDGIVGSDTMSVDLVSHVGKKRVTIFQYKRKNADPDLFRQDVPPTVTWLAENRLDISIDMISSLDKLIGEKDGVKINYHIGAVE